jgi:predicted 3-demethylubiquinone-9 3-methyltransferase (glyoxalase superfamily)
MSLQVFCDTQDEVDYFWERLGAGGPDEARQCGWLKDKYGLSWQVVPRIVEQYMVDPDPVRVARVFAAIMDMKKMDVGELRRAHAG